MKRQDSSSQFQLRLENKLIAELENELQVKGIHNIHSVPFTCVKNTKICPDIYSEKHLILGEVHVHAGHIKPAQKQKIASDIFKMILFEKDRNKEYKKYYVVCSEQEKKYLEGKSYVAAAVKLNNIDVKYYPLSATDEKKLLAVMKLQDLREKE